MKTNLIIKLFLVLALTVPSFLFLVQDVLAQDALIISKRKRTKHVPPRTCKVTDEGDVDIKSCTKPLPLPSKSVVETDDQDDVEKTETPDPKPKPVKHKFPIGRG